MAKSFNKNASPEQSGEELVRIFSGPLGPMLGQLNILSQEQQNKSGCVQAEMIAIRDTIEDGVLEQKAVKDALGEFKGNIDFDKYAKITDEERSSLLSQLGINNAYITDGTKTVSSAQKNKANVNEGHAITVPAIGFIHMGLHAKNIEHFGDIKQGALLAQRAIDAAQSMKRIQNSAPDTNLAGKRGFKLWGDEETELKQAISLALELNAAEMALEVGSGAPAIDQNNLIKRINEGFDAASNKFKSQPHLSAAIQSVKNHFIKSDSNAPDVSTKLDI